jgi:glycogen(starch) synthase
MKVRSRAGSVMSGASTPGGGTFRSLSERDLEQADAALSQVGKEGVNGH